MAVKLRLPHVSQVTAPSSNAATYCPLGPPEKVGMTLREPYLCLTCNRVMVLRRCVPSCEGQPDITIWGCLHCSEKEGAELAVIHDAAVPPPSDEAQKSAGLV